MRSPPLSDKIEQPLPAGARAGQGSKAPPTAPNRNPIHSTLSAVLNSRFLLGVEPDDGNNLGSSEIDTSFQKSIFTIYFFQSSFGEKTPYYPS